MSFSGQWQTPNLLVALTLRCSEEMQDVFGHALQQCPCSSATPWKLLFTWDEFVTGNVLKPNDSRKTMVLNMTFQELGPALGSESCWWTVAVVRTYWIKKVLGGWSAMLRAFLEMALCSPTGIQTAGVPLEIKGNLAVIYARVGTLLADGDGHRAALQWMGASSLHPCFRHWNVLMKNSERVQHDRSGEYVEIDCPDPSKFKCWSNAELATTIDVVASAAEQVSLGTMTATALERIQKSLGFRATKAGLLSSPDLRSYVDFMAVLRYDWAHSFLSDGIVSAEIWALLSAGQTHKLFDQESIYRFLQEE